MSGDRIANAIGDGLWAMTQSGLDSLAIEAERRLLLSAEELAELNAARFQPIRRGKVAVLPLSGPMIHKGGVLASLFGTTHDGFGTAFDALMDDSGIGAVVFDVDSPGGTVAGTPELAARIRSRRGEKPIIAVSNSLMASAAFWVGSAADTGVAAPSADVGSVGVLAVHNDFSGFNERIGVKPTIIKSAPFKAEGNPEEPLGDDALAFFQSRVDEMHGAFVRDLAIQRGTTENRVNKDFGQGRVMSAKQAVENGLADRVATLDQVISELTSRPKRPVRAMAGRFAMN